MISSIKFYFENSDTLFHPTNLIVQAQKQQYK